MGYRTRTAPLRRYATLLTSTLAGQEHWLFNDHLNDVREISPDFISVGVSGINDCDLLSCGQPYRGCSILYRKPFYLPVFSLLIHVRIVSVVSGCVIRLFLLTYLIVFTCLHFIVLIPN